MIKGDVGLSQFHWQCKENILKNMNHLTTSGSTFFARSWMALITIHIDDRRNMTPKITQALWRKKKKKVKNLLRIYLEFSTLLLLMGNTQLNFNDKKSYVVR